MRGRWNQLRSENITLSGRRSAMVSDEPRSLAGVLTADATEQDHPAGVSLGRNAAIASRRLPAHGRPR